MIEELESADLYWLTTVEPDGKPHVTPLIAIWLIHQGGQANRQGPLTAGG